MIKTDLLCLHLHYMYFLLLLWYLHYFDDDDDDNSDNDDDGDDDSFSCLWHIREYFELSLLQIQF